MQVTPDALDATLSHHRDLAQALTARVDTVVSAARTGSSYDEPVAALRRLLARDLVPHARAEEDVLYPAAREQPLRMQVAGMIFEHETLLPALAADPAVDLPALLPVIESRFAAHRAAAAA